MLDLVVYNRLVSIVPLSEVDFLVGSTVIPPLESRELSPYAVNQWTSKLLDILLY